MKTFSHVPGDTTARIVTPDSGTTLQIVDMQYYELFALLAMLTTNGGGGGGITRLEIVGCAGTDGSNPQTIVDSGVINAHTVGDFIALECAAVQLREIAATSGFNLRYLAGRVTCGNAGDKAAVTYLRALSKHPQANLTTNSIS
jgi:hypothetical protein